MKKILFSLILLAMVVFACGNKESLVPLAKKHLPAKLNEAMAEYDNTVEMPRIDNLKVIYDCDSLCIIQGFASAKDASGNERKETIRYIFVKDPFTSAMSGKPTYYEAVQGADPILTKKGLKDFQQKIREGGTKTFNYYVALAEPLRQSE